MRLIDGHELKKTFEAWRERLMQKAEMKLDVINVWATGRQIELIDAAIDELERMPEIREEPARRGRWIADGVDCMGYTYHFECSACGCFSTMYLAAKECEYEYCPVCGAKMDEGEQDEE